MASKDSVLILGNGISRLQYAHEIVDYLLKYSGELWGSNHVYVEYGPWLDRVNGHADVVLQAEHWKQLHGYTYRVIKSNDYKELPEKLRGNSGIFLVSQALYDGYKEILLCGFDFGGKDVWTPDMENRAVTNGLLRKWDLMLQTFPDSKQRIKFWEIKPGYDKLSEDYLSVFNTDFVQVKRLKQELAAVSGQEVIMPKCRPVTEAVRTSIFYKDRLRSPFQRKYY